MMQIPESMRTLAVALVTAFFTVVLIEPVKSFMQRRMQRRAMRRILYQELVHNYDALRGQVKLATHDPVMKSGIGERFAMGFQKLGYELAQRDPVTLYSLDFRELYWIQLRYRDMEHVINGSFTDDEQHFRCAHATAYFFLSNVKERHFNRRLIFRVSPAHLRQHFLESLPTIDYLDAVRPSRFEKVRRRLFEKSPSVSESQ